MKIPRKGLALLLLGSGLFAQGTRPSRSPAGAFRIAGTVVNANTSQPVPGAQVDVENTRNEKDTYSVVADDDGRFQFQVGLGKYSLRGAKRGFLTFAYEQHENFWTGIATGGGFDTEHLVLRLPPAAAITGKVTDDNGEPVRGATVTVYREDHRNGATEIHAVEGTTTDDLGSYEVTPIDAGTYFVMAMAEPWYAIHPSSGASNGAPLRVDPSLVDRSLDVAFPDTYYRDATEPDDATPVPVRPGDRAQADIHMNPAPALHIFFHSGSNNPRGFNQLTFQKKLLDGSFGPQPSVTEEVSTGLYEIKGLAAGRYALSGTSGGVSKAPSEIDLNTDGQSLDLSASSPTGSLKALVRIAGAKLPEQLFVVLRNGKGRQVAQSEVDQHGVADFVNLAPDQYDVVAGSPTRQYSVSAIAVADHTSSGHTLNVPAGTALTASLTLVGSTVRVEGIAQQAGKPFHGAMIVLVPGNPDANLELFRRDQSDLDGSFVLQQVIPGTYTIVAIEDGWDLDWAKPHVLAVYRRRGQKIVVGEDKGTVHLPSPVEVQPKL